MDTGQSALSSRMAIDVNSDTDGVRDTCVMPSNGIVFITGGTGTQLSGITASSQVPSARQARVQVPTYSAGQAAVCEDSAGMDGHSPSAGQKFC